MSSQPTALIFDVQDFATHDGPGVRSIVFFKGCPLRCRWCANPEGQERRLQLMHNQHRCVGCFSCAAACEREAISKGVSGREEIAEMPVFDRDRCRDCPEALCIDSCPERALRCAGESIGVDQLFERVRRNTRLYRNSGGGLTLSGGEPLAQPDFVRAFMQRCGEVGLPVGLETCGAFAWSEVEDFIADFEFIFFDIKGLDDELHRDGTGAGIERILDNLRRLSDRSADRITISVPIIPGFSDDKTGFAEVLALLGELSIRTMRLLPYHELGRGKYDELGLSYRMQPCARPARAEVERFRVLAVDKGFECTISGG